MVLNNAGIAAGWQVEEMPDNRLMVDAILTPDGNVLLINGAGSGVSIISRYLTLGIVRLTCVCGI